MKMTLLEMTQDILNDIDGDFVNSIADTEESLQVATICRSTFFELFNLKKWPHSKKLGKLQGLSDNNYPTYFKLPENLYHLESLRYDRSRANDTRILMEPILYKEPEEFLRLVNNYNVQSDNVTLYETLEGVKLKLYTDRPPQYYTTFDDEYIVLDAFDSAVEDTLQPDNSQAIYFFIPEFRLNDDFIPDLPMESFPYFLAEAKSTASLKVRQVEDAKAEQQAQRQSTRASQRSRRAASGTRYPDYGRRSHKGSGYSYRSNKLDKWSTYESN